MKKLLFAAKDDWTGLILRLTLGIVIFPHGAQKMLGWFGGNGFSNTIGYFTEVEQLPWLIAFLVILIEFFGSLLVIVGFASRLWSVSFIGLFMGIVLHAHTVHGFFMNWSGKQSGEGFEYHLLVIGLALALLINGSGRLSIDSIISGNRKEVSSGLPQYAK